MRKVICISDWAADDLAYQEFGTALSGFLKTPDNLRLSRIVTTSSTIQTGFMVAQCSYTEERLGVPSNSLIFANTDPRSVENSSSSARHGAEFMIARLTSGLIVCGPNNGFSLSFVKGHIDAVFRYVNFETLSISRSRDLFSRVIAHLVEYLEDELELEEVHMSTISDKPMDHVVLHIDNFQNIVTSFTQEEALERSEFGGYLKVNIKSEVREAKIVNHRFAGIPGELVIYPGSKGHLDNPYMEISVWHESDHRSLKKHMPFELAAPGDLIVIS